MMALFDVESVRAQFPALTHKVHGQPIIFFDGPGGTQVPASVMKAMQEYLLSSNANAHGAFITSIRTDELMNAARIAIANFLGCDRDEVVFGANMTSLTFTLSRAIARELKPGDEIIVTRLDHDANVAPWLALREQGVIIRTVDLNPEDCTLNLSDFAAKLNQQTKLVAVGYASNAVGTINDVKKIITMAHELKALVFIDAVHYAPHGLIDVQDLDCDFLVCSAYKFFGPHVGILYGKREHLNRIPPDKARPAPQESPACWETGTPNFEGLAGLVATIQYLSDLGQQISPAADSRQVIVSAMEGIQSYEQKLCQHLIRGLLAIRGITFYGISEQNRLRWRTPTVGIRIRGKTPYEIAKELGDRGIFTWHGNFYAIGLTERLGLESSGGLLRIGLVHYNAIAEIDQLLATLKEIASKAPDVVKAEGRERAERKNTPKIKARN
ncbi:cysteine desulfurase family protein, VC1184 subfamily [Xenococcus sp. PCC 7305]|uniref:cysteine desulfurase-like protein n=1 Tax=Xenococcus sp. PCC 7305 TaxID=102125 RepID=UPI0002ABEA34|nr:cysteine desulfurase-like protein [Xenococcus sp. PCC 7305]ELS00358.1 cysteine desulfurase family protein, VC1184 subfamily [Xenococcus sp. PCC 7305]